MSTDKATENNASNPAVEGPRFSEGLGPNATLFERLRAGTGGGKHWMDLHEEAANEIERLRENVVMLRATMEDATYQLSKARIWGGMDWHYNPLHPMHYTPVLDRMRKVLGFGA